MFQFGAYGDTWVAVLGAKHLDDAMEPAGAWLAEYAPGMFDAPDYKDAIRTLADEQGVDPSAARDSACLHD